MSSDSTQRSVIPFSFSASAVLQLLGATAAFLASYVLPLNFPELGSYSSTILSVIGTLLLTVGILNVLAGRFFARIMQRIGMRSRVVLPREGVVYLGVMLMLAIAALLGHSNMLLLLFGLMAAPFVLNGWVVVMMLHKVTVERQLPPNATAGESFSVELRVRNGKPWISSRLVEVRDVAEGPRHRLRQECSVTFVRVPQREARSGSYQLRISRRGLYRFGPLRVSSRFPLGIGERGTYVNDRAEIIVHPAIGRLMPNWLRRERELSESLTRTRARVGVFDDEFHRIREFRSGDNPRSIHWRSTARRGELMVKEFEQKREADLVVLLDLHESPQQTPEETELAVSLAATICVEQTRRASSGTYRLLIAGKTFEDLHTTGAGRFREAALNALAVCETSVSSDLSRMLSMVGQSDVSSAERFVLITSRPAYAEKLLQSLSENGDARSMSLVPRTTIIRASQSELSRIFEPSSTPPLADESHSQPLSLNGSPDSAMKTSLRRSTTAEEAPAEQFSSRSDLRLRRTFHRSVMMTTALAGTILCAAEGSLFPSVVTPIVAVLAWILVDWSYKFRLPLAVANCLGLVALTAAVAEFVSGNIEAKLLSGAHLIVYLTWIVLLMHKSVRQYWWLIALSLLQLAVAAVLTTSGSFGASLFGMLLVMLWTMSVFSLFRVQDQRHQNPSKLVARSRNTPAGTVNTVNTVNTVGTAALAGSGPEPRSAAKLLTKSADVSFESAPTVFVKNGIQRDPSEPWISLRFRGVVAVLFLMSVVLSLVVFTAFPRVWVPGNPFSKTSNDDERRSGIVHRTGFTDTVRLGEIGTVMQNDDRVLQFSISEIATGANVTAEAFADAMNTDELRFRGNAMAHYSDGQWARGVEEKGYRGGEFETGVFSDIVKVPPTFRVDISQDPPVSQFAFAVFPLTLARAREGSGQIYQRTVTNSLIWIQGRSISPQAQRSFYIECPSVKANPRVTFEHWMIPDRTTRGLRTEMIRRRDAFAAHITITPDLDQHLPRLYALSNQLCADPNATLDPKQKIDRILKHLSPANGFRYSLSLTRKDKSLDPLEDFLVNMKSGHCEYYASACTLMLQAVKIPARLVNGFYGSEMNSVTGKYEVKQRHAHAWVEAFVDGYWMTLDPTPGDERLVDVAAVKTGNVLSDLRTAFSDLWTGGIHNMTLERQRAFFAPLLKLVGEIRDEFRNQGVGATLKRLFRDWVLSPDKWFSWQGGVVTFLFLLLCAGVARLHPLQRLIRRLSPWMQYLASRNRKTTTVIRFYSRFCALCEAQGLKFSATGTALENAALAVRHFASRLSSDDLKLLPLRIAAAFNDVRFGAADLSELQLAGIGQDLETFAEALSQRSQDSTEPMRPAPDPTEAHWKQSPPEDLKNRAPFYGRGEHAVTDRSWNHD